MKFVFDASVAVKWQLGEHDSEKAQRIIDTVRSGRDELHAPDFFLVECGHAFFRAERGNRIAAGEARKLLIALLTDCPQIHESRPLLARAAAICQHLRKGLYDCVYMALAEREGAHMITADAKLFAATKADYPYVAELASFP
jgi:predicted nucleic acid-binding protein